MSMRHIVFVIPADSGYALCLDCAREKYSDVELDNPDDFSVVFTFDEALENMTCDTCFYSDSTNDTVGMR